MKIGAQSAVIDRVYGPERALSIVRSAGFETIDFSLESETRLYLHSTALKNISKILKNMQKI